VYLYAVSVVLDGFALLQTVKKHLEAVVQIRAHILVEDIYAQLEVFVKIHSAQWTLQEEGLLVVLNGFGLCQ
jgi:hypothetical protein